MARYSIFISSEEYKHFSPTKFTHADSKLIYSTLTEQCDYSKQHSLLLNLSIDNGKSPSDILDEIKNTVSKSSPGDSILFYFAGHGHYDDGQTYLILPNTVPGAYESTALALEDISKELRRSDRLCYRIFDACHSGVDVRDDNSKLDANSFLRAVTHDASSGWVTLAACKEDQFSIGDPQIGHGVFTYYLCKYISGLEANEQIYPELLKIKIADDVYNHSKKLGYAQNPTLNASISGNIFFATRRADPPREVSTHETTDNDVSTRIAKLNSTKNILAKESLEEIFKIIVDECEKNFKSLNAYNFDIICGSLISADDIPENMHQDVVEFSKRQSLQPRHELKRHVDEYEESSYMDSALSSLAYLYPKKKRKETSYWIKQGAGLPKTALILDLKGDGKCVPNIRVLLFLIPLQITACMLVSAFKENWPPFEKELDLICSSYQMVKPNDTEDRIREVGPFSSKRTMEKIGVIVSNRINQLERELNN
ncbi:MAG: caspase family protein [Desulfobulbaceae bacterium]|nr:caspase family protein [Desulfobulbaceae bacterium]